MALATIKPSPTQLLGRFGGPKWIPKELPELPRSVLERFGMQNGLQMSSQSEGKSSKKYVFLHANGLFASPGVLVAS